MEISNNQNVTYNNIPKVKEILIKASKDPRFSKYITEDKIQEALSNIVICKDDEEFFRQVDLVVPGISRKDPSVRGLKAFQAVESKKIVFKNNCSIETIVHELVHYFSLDGKSTGILDIGTELVNDKQNHDWNTLNDLHVDILNEAITHYITQELLPEIKISDAYNYGARFLKDYADASGNMDKILDSYFNKNKRALDFIAKDVNKEGIISWHDILEASGLYQYTNMMIFRNFEANFKKCDSERRRIDSLISAIKNRSRNFKSTQALGQESVSVLADSSYIADTEHGINSQAKIKKQNQENSQSL